MSSEIASHHIALEAEHERFFVFINLALFMAAITGLELVIIFVPFPTALVFAAIVVLSAVKFLGVITWFMHLIYDKVFCTVLFMIGLVIAICTAAALLALFDDADRIIQYEELQRVSMPPMAGRSIGLG